MGFPINEKLSQGIAVLSAVHSPTLTTAVLTPAIDLAKTRKVMAVVTAGTLGTSATVTAKLQGCATSGGSYADISGSSVTLVKATDDNKSQVLEIGAESLNNLGLGYRFVKVSVSADVSSAVTVTVVGGGGPEEPISANNTANVKAITVI